MGLAMLMVGADDSTTMTNIGRSLSRSSSPSIDVAVRHSLCNGTQNDTLSKHCLAVVVEYGVEPWVPEGVDHVFISYVGPWYRGRRVDRRISEVGFSCSSILEYGGEGVKGLRKRGLESRVYAVKFSTKKRSKLKSSSSPC